MKALDRDFFFDELQKMYPEAIIELNYSTPFQLLIAVILSAQATDKQVNKVTDTLFEKIKWPADVIRMWHENFTTSIRSIWLYKGKWRNIFATSKRMSTPRFNLERQSKATQDKAHELYDTHGYYIPDTLEWLMELHWVWEKTAKVVLRALYEIPYVAVDTHVHRVSNRIGLVKTKSPLQTSKIIEKKIGKKYILPAHHTIILFGRYHCLARKPKCQNCPFTKICVHYNKIIKPTLSNQK